MADAVKSKAVMDVQVGDEMVVTVTMYNKSAKRGIFKVTKVNSKYFYLDGVTSRYTDKPLSFSIKTGRVIECSAHGNMTTANYPSEEDKKYFEIKNLIDTLSKEKAELVNSLFGMNLPSIPNVKKYEDDKRLYEHYIRVITSMQDNIKDMVKAFK